MWNPSPFFISNSFCETQKNSILQMIIQLRNFHGLSPWSPVMPSTAILWCPVSSQWPPSRWVSMRVIFYTRLQKYFSGLCNINKWWKQHRSHCIVARFGYNFVCHVTYLPIYPQGDNGTNFLTTVTYNSYSNSKLYKEKNDCVPNPPVELAQYLNEWWFNSLILGFDELIRFTWHGC